MLFRPGGVNLRAYLCGVQSYASAQSLDFLARTKNLHFPNRKPAVSHPELPDGNYYREACRARSKAEFIAKVGDCLKELDESSYWFELFEETGTVASASLEPLQKECNELLAIFTTIAKKCKIQETKVKG